MRREIKVKTGHMLDSSDLTVVAPIRQGLVPSLDAVSYKTRAERVLQLLQLGRLGQHEFELTRVLADAVERVGMIHAVRVAVIEPQNLVMLSVTFDGGWEPYMRVIWHKVSRLLDLIFSNTEGYVFGWESSYEEWMTWLRCHQVNSPFFYSQPAMTAGDIDLLRRQEWLQRQSAGQETAARLLQISQADAVEAVLGEGPQPDPRFPGSEPYRTLVGGNYLLARQSVRALAALHRLTDVFLPGTHDGWVLHRAAREALARLHADGVKWSDAVDRFSDALSWLKLEEPDPPASRQAPPLQATLKSVLPQPRWSEVQSGILEALDADHGSVLLMRFDTPSALGTFLRKLPLTHHDQPFNKQGISVSVALSIEGLRLAGFTDDELRTWPEAFYQGMHRRAGSLGDVRSNHPRNWHLPGRLKDGAFAANEADDGRGTTQVDLSEMHVLLQVRLQSGKAPTTAKQATRKLRAFLAKWTAPQDRLAVQWLHRQKRTGPTRTVDHFEWRDAHTGPVFDLDKSSGKARDHAHLGEALCGHANAADHCWPAATQPCAPWLANGSFLVVRKLRQDVAALNDAVASVTPALDSDLVRAKLMGRWHDGAKDGNAGRALVESPPSPESNDFSFSGDPDGSLCPVHSHIRRANPRLPAVNLTNYPPPPATVPQGSVRPSKILRRGMSYGPTFGAGREDDERGLFFMAYNSSIAEQFEVIQRWLSGGNSGGADSGQADPLLGVPTPGQARTCFFHHDGQLHRVTLEPAAHLNEDPHQLVRLEWGAYWFAPSLPTVAEIAKRAGSARETALWSPQRGEEEIRRLLALERSKGHEVALLAWKEALEDPESLNDYRAASIWAAVREYHDGHLRCAFGVLVGDPDGVDCVLRDEQLYSATGYQARMRYSFGPIFLGCDAGSADGVYERESAHIVAAITKLPVEDTYALARDFTANHLKRLQRITIEAAHEAGEERWRLAFEVRELIDDLLGRVCETWFGIRSGTSLPFDAGGLDVARDARAKPRNPGHFASPSRYFFQPHPSADVARVGQAHGLALRRAMQELLDAAHPDTVNAPLVQAILANPLSTTDAGYAARTLTGVVMGFVPTVDGTVRRILADWLREGTFWRLRGQSPSLGDFKQASQLMRADLVRAIQMRAAPELLWRTAAAAHTMGIGTQAVSVQAGDRVVAGLMSATQCRWQQGSSDYHHVFGGDRLAEAPPTHACPGTPAAMALMMGFFAALLETDLPLRPGPAILSFEARGLEQLQAPLATAKLDERLRARDLVLTTPPTAGAGGHDTLTGFSTEFRFPSELSGVPVTTTRSFTTPVKLMTVGDSWPWRGLPVWPTLSQSLSRHGYKLDKDFAGISLTMDAIAKKAELAAPYLADVDMVLLDGGGNDVHQAKSFFFPDPQNPDWASLGHSGPPSTLDDLLTGKNGNVQLLDASLKKFIHVFLRQEMKRALTALTTAAHRRPVIVIGYDYPIPNGNDRPGVGPWLKPAFARVGLDANNPGDLKLSTDLMKQLIGQLNNMIADLVRTEFQGKSVYAVNLTGTLTSASDWDDELHPTKTGFDNLALTFVREISKLPAEVPRPTP